MSQLALPLQLADHAVFASFLAAGNEAAVAAMQELADNEQTGGCWLWGVSTTGKTHILQAACEQAGDKAVYVPLRLFGSGDGQLLDGLATRALICIDDIDSVAGNTAWEQALFTLYNEVIDAGGCIAVAAQCAPRAAGFQLPDLESRLTALPVFQLRPLDDEGAKRALQLRASHRGLDLPDDTAQFLLSRSRRDMASLCALLDKLDSEALRAQRRLTIPFVRAVLDINN